MDISVTFFGANGHGCGGGGGGIDTIVMDTLLGPGLGGLVVSTPSTTDIQVVYYYYFHQSRPLLYDMPT